MSKQIRLTPDINIDYSNDDHYDDMIKSFYGICDDYILCMISYLFGKYDAIEKITKKNYKQFINSLDKLGITGCKYMLNQEFLKKINIKLISLCASHINSIERFEKLENMLISWNNQMFKIKIILSISCDKEYTDDLKKWVNKIEDLYESNIYIICTYGEIKKQFEHYEIICDTYYKLFNEYWIICTDDDDIWSKNRSFAFGIIIQNLKELKCLEEIQYVQYPFICEGSKYISNNEIVTSEYTSGNIKMSVGRLEYICYSVKFKEFAHFCEKCEQELLKNDFCDRYFIKYLTHNVKLKYGALSLPYFGFGYYYFNSNYYDNAYLENKTKSLIDMAKFELNIYYSYHDNNDNIIPWICDSFKKQNWDIKVRNDITTYIFEHIKNCDFMYLKNSPIMNI
jgi:hypothetical protein